MNNVKISHQIILRENTNVAALMLKTSLDSLLASSWPDHVVIVNNGCSAQVGEIYREFMKEFKQRGNEVVLIDSPEQDYQGLRNVALAQTPSDTTHVSWGDADEVLIPEKWFSLKELLKQDDAAYSKGTIFTHFYHFVVIPTKWQFHTRKDNIFKYHKDLKWSNAVHEKLLNLLPGRGEVEVDYLHFGYCKAQWRLFARWLRYALLEHGSINVYKQENVEGKIVDYLREWRTPNTIIDDRIPESHDWTLQVPEIARPIMAKSNWEKWIREVDDESFWERWQDKYKEVDNWKDTLDWAVEELTKLDWKVA